MAQINIKLTEEQKITDSKRDWQKEKGMTVTLASYNFILDKEKF